MKFDFIDFHTHPFLLERNNICQHKKDMPLTPEEFAKDLKSCSISHFAGSVICHRDSGLDAMREGNAQALTLKNIYVNKYIPGIMIDANYVDESISEIDSAKEHGIRLIGELVPYAMGWSFSDASLRDILDHTAKSEFVYSLHSTDDVDTLETLASEYPNTSFVFAHPGEMLRLKRHIEAMKRHDNIYLDLSGTGLLRYGMLKRLVSEVGAERILFGTDYPICNPAMYVAAVLFEKITDKERELIMKDNAKRLLCLK